MSAEAERILAGVSPRIGDSADTDIPGDAGSVEDADAAELAGLMDMVQFTPEDTAAAVATLCESMDRWFDSDVWALSQAQQKLIGRPYAQLANALWGRLKLRLPGFLTAACESTPGLMGALMATGMVFGPKAYQQWNVSRERAREQTRPTIIASNETPRAQAPTEMPSAQHTPGGSRLRWPKGQGPRQ